MAETAAEIIEAPEDDSLEGECRALFTEAEEAKERLGNLAKSVEQNGHPELAKIYREISGTVLTLISDLTATCGGGFGDLAEDLERLGGGDPTESVLLEEDAKLYVAYFEQVLRLLRELHAVSEAAQQPALEALIRMTEERLEFTRDITVDGEPDDEPDDADGDGEEEKETPS